CSFTRTSLISAWDSAKWKSVFVSELCHIPPSNPDEQLHLRGDADEHRCWGKSLMGNALVRFGVRQHARAESISKRAPSTTRTSLRFRINGLRAPQTKLSQNCVRPPNLLRSRSDTRGRRERQDRPALESCSRFAGHRLLSGEART